MSIFESILEKLGMKKANIDEGKQPVVKPTTPAPAPAAPKPATPAAPTPQGIAQSHGMPTGYNTTPSPSTPPHRLQWPKRTW